MERWHKTRHFSRDTGDGCPVCGGEPDVAVIKHNSILRKKLEDAGSRIEILKNNIKLQEEVIKEQIKDIYDYIKSENS